MDNDTENVKNVTENEKDVIETDENVETDTNNETPVQPDSESFSSLAVKKIAAELDAFKGGNKESAVSKFVASTITKFCEENERFAEVVYKTPRTLSDCCAEVMDGCGSSISDIDVYRGAVKSYFPNADIHFIMEITIEGEAPSEEEIKREPKKKAPVTKAPEAKAPKSKKETAKPQKSSPKAAAAKKEVEPKNSAPKIETLQLTLF